MEEKEIMLKIENVSKIYKLGEIGGTTLRETFQRLWAKMRHKEDPTKKIGAKNYNKGEKFKALDNISFEVRKGERIGIIGHNGAGKSTLLKLISRVTGPTEGKIYLNGRVASMLEVGTGFNPELTGRENIYMNGAILGMTKKEIDSKIEDIIEFSEVRQFIDTPVKRYSSGMYVKLAFSVAAHLDSEIMIMDEVLAVGDMAFQQKCLNKMREVSEQEDKTILYVSHNMNTIKQLCDRVVVLNSGQIEFDGDVNEGINRYLQNGYEVISKRFFKPEKKEDCTGDLLFAYIEIIPNNPIVLFGQKILIKIGVEAMNRLSNVVFRFTITSGGSPVCSFFTDGMDFDFGLSNNLSFIIDTSFLAPSNYTICLHAANYVNGNYFRHDRVTNAICFKIENEKTLLNLDWDEKYWGNVIGPNAELVKRDEN